MQGKGRADGLEDRGGGGWQHLHPRAGGGLRRPLGAAANGRAGAARPRRAAPGGGRRPRPPHARAGRLRRPAGADRAARGGAGRRGLRDRPASRRRAGAAAHRRDAAAGVRLHRPGDHRAGIVTQALLDQGHRAIGLCNVAIGFQRRLAAQLVVEPHRVELGHVGLNHLSWLRAVRVDGVDRLPELLAEHAEALAAEVELPVELLRLLGAIPSSYLRYYYLTGEVLDEQRRGPSRAEQVAEIELELLRLYRDPALDTKPALLERRGGAFYSEAAAQLVASLHAGTGDLQVVDVRNDGAIPDLPDDAVVEVPARVDAAGAHPLPQDPLPPELLGLVQQMKAYERLTVAAARGGDRALALE